MRIQEGDICTVIMARNDVFTFQTSCRFKAVIVHIPVATGDCFHFSIDETLIVVNPQSSDFIGLEKGK